MAPAQPSASAVATAPAATQPVPIESMEPIADGTIRFVPPAGWELVGRSPDNLAVTYKASDAPEAALTLTIIPQTQTIQPTAREQMGLIIGKGIREAAKQHGHALVYGPRVEPDERYFLKVRDVMSVGQGKLADRVQMYRIVGLNLVHVACTAQVEARELSAPVHAAAEKLLDTMRVARGAKRSVYPRAQLKAVVPLDWREQKTDQANGLVATYTDPKDPSRQMVLRCRVMPKDAREPGPKRDALLGRMIDDERRHPPLTGASADAEEVITTDPPKYLKHLRTSATSGAGGAGGEPLRVETRYVAVGDVMVSVRSVAREADADAVAKIAEQVAGDLKTIRD